MTYREPTPEECSARTVVDLGDGRNGWACWYPSMGGYVGKAVVILDDGCVEVLVWHNGDFPFGGQVESWPGEPVPSPARLHHCDGGQFVTFGEFLNSLDAPVTR